MKSDERDILDVLKAELAFVEKGGYEPSPDEPWRAKLIFEDSPSCVNYEHKQDRRPCSQCALTQLVPEQSVGETAPCRHIPLTGSGETLLKLYRGGTQEELESIMGNWLRNTIAKIEAERTKVGVKLDGQEQIT